MNTVPDDGLLVASIKEHSLPKLKKHAYYAGVFSTAVKNKFDQRCYVGICTGPGRARVEETGEVVETSPLQVLRLTDPFTKYVFCDSDAEAIAALQKRVAAIEGEVGRSFDVEYITGDVNDEVARVDDAIPTFNKRNTLLTFCFLDPFAANIRFHTIRRLCASRNIDLLALLPVGHDARRNLEKHYLPPGNSRIEEWLDRPDWRDRWEEAKAGGETFVYFLARLFGESMEGLGYLPIENRDLVPIRIEGKKTLLYLLAFYSKHPLGLKLWREADERTDVQTALDL